MFKFSFSSVSNFSSALLLLTFKVDSSMTAVVDVSISFSFVVGKDDSIDTFVTLSDRNVVRGSLLSSVSRVLVYLLVEVIVSVEEVELSAYMKSSHNWGLTERKIL